MVFRGVLISLIVHKAWAIRFSVAKMLPRLYSSGSIRLGELYVSCKSRGEVIAAFISVLELCSMGSISIDRSGEDYSLSFVGGDIDEILEKIVE